MNSIVIHIEDMAHQLMNMNQNRISALSILNRLKKGLIDQSLKEEVSTYIRRNITFRKEIENLWQLIEDYEGQISNAFKETNKRWIE